MRSNLRPLLLILTCTLSVGLILVGPVPPTQAQSAATLRINELDYDQPGTDTAEYVELFNGGTESVALNAYSLVFINGANGGSAVYTTVALPAATLAPGAYFVVCGDPATVVRCDLDGGANTDFIQNGAPDAVALLLNGTIADTVSYEGNVPGYTEGAGETPGETNDAPNVSLQRCPDGSDSDNNAADFQPLAATPGTANCASVVTPTSPGEIETPTATPATPTATLPPVNACEQPVSHYIWQVQGAAQTSPITGQRVTVEGVVVGDYQDDTQPDSADGRIFYDLDGFYLQEESAAPDSDGNLQTSDGIFVFAPGGANVSAGDVVRVTGTVAEFASSGSSLTQLTSPSYGLCGQTPLPAPQQLAEPVADAAGYEPYEGMLVQYAQPLRIAEYFDFDRFGEIVLCQPDPADPANEQDRLYQPTAIDDPASPARAARASYNAAACITLDDGRSSQNPDPARHPNGNEFTTGSDTDELDGNRFRGGDIVAGVTGILDERFGVYRIQPTTGATYSATNPRQPQPAPVGGSLRAASFNVLNYFTTLDTNPGSDNGPNICGPQSNQECRGANTQEEFTRQRTKIIEALYRINADIVGLIELENHPNDTALADLVAGLNARFGTTTYDYIRTGPIGTDAIKVAFVFKPATVTPVGAYEILDTSDDPRFIDTRNRPALAQTFRENATGAVFTPVINHFKSKGSGCGAGDDDPVQGNCTETRRLAAQALVDWLATDPTGSGDPDVLILGDLNSYDKEDPIDAIRAGADDTLGTADDYTDLELAFQGEYAYSYLFDAQFGYLDYGLAIQALVPQVTGALSWHINADEPDIIDYDMTFKPASQDALYEPNPYKSSDHDPVIVGLQLASAAGTPTPTASTTTPTNTPTTTPTNTPTSTPTQSPTMTQTPTATPVPTCSGLAATITDNSARDDDPRIGSIRGTNGNDVIVGTNGNDRIDGRNGNDVICGLGGDDTIDGNNGNDTIDGGVGTDRIDGNNGNDVLRGGDGNDTIDAGNGNDHLFGDAGNDTLRAANGNDRLTGGSGADAFSGGNGSDRVLDFNQGAGDTRDQSVEQF